MLCISLGWTPFPMQSFKDTGTKKSRTEQNVPQGHKVSLRDVQGLPGQKSPVRDFYKRRESSKVFILHHASKA